MVISQQKRVMSRKSVGEDGSFWVVIGFVGTSGIRIELLCLILVGSLAG